MTKTQIEAGNMKTIKIGDFIWLNEDFTLEEQSTFSFEEAVAHCPDGWRLPCAIDIVYLLYQVGFDYRDDIAYGMSEDFFEDIEHLIPEALEKLPLALPFAGYCRPFDEGCIHLSDKSILFFGESQNEYHFRISKRFSNNARIRYIQQPQQDSTKQFVNLIRAELLPLTVPERAQLLAQHKTRLADLQNRRLIYIDKRDCMIYNLSRINGQYWLTDDFAFQTEQLTILRDEKLGSYLYSIKDLVSICPDDCAIPSKADWDALFAKHLRSILFLNELSDFNYPSDDKFCGFHIEDGKSKMALNYYNFLTLDDDGSEHIWRPLRLRLKSV